MNIKNHNRRFWALCLVLPAIIVISLFLYIQAGRAPFTDIVNSPTASIEQRADALFNSIPVTFGRLVVMVYVLFGYTFFLGVVWNDIYPKEGELADV